VDGGSGTAVGVGRRNVVVSPEGDIGFVVVVVEIGFQ
jgi:hypothetical protein